jgi:AcrR family transcriptional regulator
MRRRAQQVAETRGRIVEATVRLHCTIGLRATVTEIAEEARVTRLTVYRHFPDVVALYRACTVHWMSMQVPPNPDAWAQIADPARRLRTGLADLYRFYRGGEPMLTQVRRDQAALPEERRQMLQDMDARHREVLVEPFTVSGTRRRRLHAVVGHAVSFWTWRSLCIAEGLADREAVGAMAALVLTVGGAGGRDSPP